MTISLTESQARGGDHPRVVRPLKAYEDIEFLKSDACRTARLQLEFLKPEVAMQEQGIESTIVLFGSARMLSPEQAVEELARAESSLRAEPGSGTARRQVQVAKTMVEQSRYYTVARELARMASEYGQGHGTRDRREWVVTTGGGGGIMEAGNRGAHDAGAKSIALNITLPREQHANPYCCEELSFQFHYFSIRKMHFLMRAKALCAFPGGFGTLDELFETLTLIQTGKIEPMPVVLFGESYWKRVVNWQELADRGMIGLEDLSLFSICETAADGWQRICQFYETGAGSGTAN